MILFIEDIDGHVRNFKPLLEQYDKVHHFDNLRETILFLKSNKLEDIKLVVCDHNFPIRQAEHPAPNGTSVFLELVFSDYPNTFVHFSAEPCPAKYDNGNGLNNFVNIKKESGSQDTYNKLERILKETYSND